MLDISRLQYVSERMVNASILNVRRVDAIALHDPQDWGQDFMHSLSVSNVRVHLAPHEQYIQHHVLRSRLAKVDIVRHASFDVLEDFGTEGLVGTESYPWGLSSLSMVNMRCTSVVGRLGNGGCTSSFSLNGSTEDSNSSGCCMARR